MAVQTSETSERLFCAETYNNGSESLNKIKNKHILEMIT